MLLARPVTAVARCASVSPAAVSRTLPRAPFWVTIRNMADVKDSIPHLERTANDPRQREVYTASISRIELVNSRIRLIRLSLQKDGPPLRHLPGQYVDLQIPNIPTVGGFTITSPPQTAILRSFNPSSNQPLPFTEDTSEFPCLDLAIQKAPNNKPAAYLWRDPSTILDASVSLRIGGNFTYPPATLSMADFQKIENVVFIAGGVGINPIMSMLNAMDLLGTGRMGGMIKRVRTLYSSKRDVDEKGNREAVLFEDRLNQLAEKYRDSEEVDFKYTFSETGQGGKGRISHQDLYDSIGDIEMRKKTLVYICGIPSMTDEFVGLLKGTEGMDQKRVLCEKWW